MNTARALIAAVSLVAAIAATGCSGDHSGSMHTSTPPSVPMPNPAIRFTEWSKQSVFAQAEQTTPIEFEQITFTYDGNDNPDLYTDLLPP